jgi:hypothetical protein
LLLSVSRLADASRYCVNSASAEQFLTLEDLT